MISERKIAANRRNWKRRGPLTEEGRDRLRKAALRDRPWVHSTGPRTAAGNARSRLNAVRSGRYTARMRTWRRDATRFIALDHLLRDGLLGRREVDDPGAVVNELASLARRLSKYAPR